ncbi:hypothetical protein CYMTET_41420 [Cymbomonas tetramitiformis]|uniref:Uncharacterized protein n=1 Tax=Cymbomonas tetramitiformis TaxID=36881 RepID=A0AAE0F2N6_9CHLO|nr:hypothetical protein CYMTET_41420 [Cymbomonas tetramitiformis]
MWKRVEMCIVATCAIPLSMLALYSLEQYKKHAHLLVQRNEEARRLLLAVCIDDNGQLIRYIDDFVDCSLIQRESLDDKILARAVLYTLQDVWSEAESHTSRLAHATAAMLQSYSWLIWILTACAVSLLCLLQYCKRLCIRAQSSSLPILQTPSTAVMLQNGTWIDHYK